MVIHVPLANGKGVALVDDEDVWVLDWNWKLHPRGYACRRDWLIDRTVLMHRQIYGEDKALFVDHKDRNKLNNQRYNLRDLSATLNNLNREASRIHMSYRKDGSVSRYRPVVKLHGKAHTLGSFRQRWMAEVVVRANLQRIFAHQPLSVFRRGGTKGQYHAPIVRQEIVWWK